MTQEEIDAIPDEKTFSLRKPLQFDGQLISVVVLREPTGAELKRITTKVGAERDYFAISLISGIAQPFVERIGARDLALMSDYLASFTARALPKGPES